MSLKYLINSVAGFAALLIATFCTATEGNATLVFVANLNGPSESPPNASLGTGVAEVDFDTVADTMRVSVAFQGLLGTTTASHIHCCTTVPLTGTAGVATQVPTFPSFPLG